MVPERRGKELAVGMGQVTVEHHARDQKGRMPVQAEVSDPVLRAARCLYQEDYPKGDFVTNSAGILLFLI